MYYEESMIYFVQERRDAYEQRVLECRHAEAARSELADLVAKLQEKVRRAALTIRCSGCSRRHARTSTNRPCYAARYCAQCKINHSAKEVIIVNLIKITLLI